MIKIRFISRGFLIAIFLISCSQRPELAEEEIPTDLPKFTILHGDGEVFDGYIFLKKLENPGVQFMINYKGKVVWYQRSDTSIAREFMPYNESYLTLYNDKELHEITYSGDTLLKLRYGVGGFDRTLHHEVIMDRQNRIVALTKDSLSYDLSRFGGNESDTLITDGIIVLSREGQKLWYWTFAKVLDTLSHVDENIFQIKNDWVHANSIFEDKDGNYLVSWRDLNQIWKINSQTGDVMWKFDGTQPNNDERGFKAQHSIHLNLDGDYMVFDNGPDNFKFFSRAVAFNLTSDGFRNTLVINLPDSVFTNKEGSVYQFTEDKFLFCVSRTNDLIITNREGQVLWHAKADVGFYRAYYLDKSVLDR